MPNYSGVTYYKLNSHFNGDMTKNCSLNASEVDHNFFFLRGYDIIDFDWNDDNTLELKRVNGDVIVVTGITNSVDASQSYLSGDTLHLVINGEDFPVDGFYVDADFDELKKAVSGLSITVSGLSQVVDVISGNMSQISIQLTNIYNRLINLEENKADNSRVDVIESSVTINTGNIYSAQTEITEINNYIDILEEYPGPATKPSISLIDVPAKIVMEVGETYTITIPPSENIIYADGKFDSKGTIEVTPEYTHELDDFKIFVKYHGEIRRFDPAYPDYDVYLGEFKIMYHPVVTFHEPTNLPLTNYNNPTPLTSATDTTSAATWQEFTTCAGAVNTVVIGKYPCFTNVSNDSVVPGQPVTKLGVREKEKYIVKYPPNRDNTKYEFYYPAHLDTPCISLDSGVFGFMAINDETYHIEDVNTSFGVLPEGVEYKRIIFDTVKNTETMTFLFLFEK